MKLQDFQYVEWLAAERGWKVGDAFFYARHPRPIPYSEPHNPPPALIKIERRDDNVVQFPRRGTVRG
jgi:hypothetical protein